MLYSRPTKHGAGIIVFGDEIDLRSLLWTVRKLYDGPPFRENLVEFLYDLAHEIESASWGIRKPMPKGHSKPESEAHSWVMRLWPRFLMEMPAFIQRANVNSPTFLLSNIAQKRPCAPTTRSPDQMR